MTPEERQLIAGLFERMRGFGAPEKDRDAEALINQQIRALPDASYMLVQSVLVQEQALQNAQDRIQDLEARLQELEGGEAPRKSGGFLGGYWGGRRDAEPRTSSVPQVGGRATPPAYESRSPWSQPQAAPPAQAQAPAPAAAGGGGFMRSALTTAAGVAGGMLLADGLRNMMGGAHAGSSATGSPFGGGSKDKEESHYVDERDNDPGDATDDDNDPGFDSGDSGGEIEI
jgi:hypothetical protein